MPKKQSTGLRLSQGKVEVVNKNEDSPLPSSEELYRLYEFRPDLVDVASVLVGGTLASIIAAIVRSRS